MSYVQENREIVALLIEELRRHAVDPWWDRDSLLPGTFWQDEIRRSIRGGQFFIACFSTEYLQRDRTYMNEELAIAIEEIRLRGDATWFIPVVLSGEVPDRPIGDGRTLRDIQFLELTAEHWGRGVASLCRALGASSEMANTAAMPETVPANASKAMPTA